MDGSIRGDEFELEAEPLALVPSQIATMEKAAHAKHALKGSSIVGTRTDSASSTVGVCCKHLDIAAVMKVVRGEQIGVVLHQNLLVVGSHCKQMLQVKGDSLLIVKLLFQVATIIIIIINF